MVVTLLQRTQKLKYTEDQLHEQLNSVVDTVETKVRTAMVSQLLQMQKRNASIVKRVHDGLHTKLQESMTMNVLFEALMMFGTGLSDTDLAVK